MARIYSFTSWSGNFIQSAQHSTLPFVFTCCIVLFAAVGGSAQCNSTSTIGSNFNGTSINGGNYLWFNSHLTGVSGYSSVPFTIYYEGGTVTFTSNGTPYTLPVPKAAITFSSAVTQASTFYNAATDTWETQIPIGSANNDPSCRALPCRFPPAAFPEGPTRLPGPENFIRIRRELLQYWQQWSAAVYTSFSTNYNALGVQVIDGNRQSGTPNNYTNFVTGGAAAAAAQLYRLQQRYPKRGAL
ncbi:MAG: hypothetical protein H6559_26340 [Lewinellaceae bacterium]|nr:hypothetical protein [Lewinellaceae bacterium]